MRLSGWRTHAPAADAVSAKVVRVIESALTTIGAETDPECWVIWGEDPGIRYLLFIPIDSGLVQVNVRVSVPGEGPRAAAKVIRWSRVQVGELAVEIQGGHRLVTFQAEGQVLSGVDDAADAIATFARVLFASIDGRPIPTPPAAAAPVRATARKAGVASSRKAVAASTRTRARKTSGGS
jgi:hypothetical protein